MSKPQKPRQVHGESKTGETAEYRSWAHIVQRCTNPKNPSWQHYGGRGITICDEWRTDYAAFVRDVGRRPSPRHSIDRINNDGNYEPGNVRWATPQEQARNKSTNVLVTLDGETMCLADWSERLQITTPTLAYRLRIGTFPFGVKRMATLCQHRERKHYAHGLCRNCYNADIKFAERIRARMEVRT